VQRADRLRLVVDVELGDEVLQRVGRDRLAGGIARLEQVDDLGVEDLVSLGAGFGEDSAAVLGVVNMAPSSPSSTKRWPRRLIMTP